MSFIEGQLEYLLQCYFVTFIAYVVCSVRASTVYAVGALTDVHCCYDTSNKMCQHQVIVYMYRKIT